MFTLYKTLIKSEKIKNPTETWAESLKQALTKRKYLVNFTNGRGNANENYHQTPFHYQETGKKPDNIQHWRKTEAKQLSTLLEGPHTWRPVWKTICHF